MNTIHTRFTIKIPDPTAIGYDRKEAGNYTNKHFIVIKESFSAQKRRKGVSDHSDFTADIKDIFLKSDAFFKG